MGDRQVEVPSHQPGMVADSRVSVDAGSETKSIIQLQVGSKISLTVCLPSRQMHQGDSPDATLSGKREISSETYQEIAVRYLRSLTLQLCKAPSYPSVLPFMQSRCDINITAMLSQIIPSECLKCHHPPTIQNAKA